MRIGHSLTARHRTCRLGPLAPVRLFASCVGVVAVLAQLASAQQQLSKLLASDGGAGDSFGASVDIDGSFAVVGAYQHDHLGVASNSGGAYVYLTSTGQQLSELIPPGFSPVSSFGRSVAVSGGRVVVGAYTANGGSGTAFTFDAASGQWTNHLQANNGAPGGGFGIAVAIDGRYVAVGSHASGVYVFNSSTGTQLQQIIPNDGAFTSNDSLAISGYRVITARQTGEAYVFNAFTGHQIYKLIPSGVSGHLVAIQDDRALVGGNGSTAYLFDLTNGAEVRSLTASGIPAWLGLSATRAFFGIPTQGGGRVEVYETATGQLLATLAPTDSTFGFGYWGGVDGDKAICGAIADPTLGVDAGAAYLFDVDTSTAFSAYGGGCPGSGAIVPTLALSGTPSPGGQVQVAITNGVGSGSAFIVMGLQQTSLAMGFGCTLNVNPLLPAIVGPIPLFPFGAQGAGAGSINFPATIPTNVSVPVTLTLQAFVVDSGVQAGYSNTNGVELNIH
jgi:hypothetical protein